MPKRVQMTGDKAVLRMLRELPNRAARKVNRRAVNLATTPILQAVKDECPVDAGELKKSQIKKITNNGMRANGIVGADADYTSQGGSRVAKGEGDPAAAMKVPSKYDHLVEYGHVTPDGTTTVPNPYIQRGWDAGIGTAQRTLEETLAAGVEAEAAALGGG